MKHARFFSFIAGGLIGALLALSQARASDCETPENVLDMLSSHYKTEWIFATTAAEPILKDGKRTWQTTALVSHLLGENHGHRHNFIDGCLVSVDVLDPVDAIAQIGVGSDL